MVIWFLNLYDVSSVRLSKLCDYQFQPSTVLKIINENVSAIKFAMMIQNKSIVLGFMYDKFKKKYVNQEHELSCKCTL